MEPPDAAPTPQLGQAAGLAITGKLNAELRGDLQHLEGLLGRNAKHHECICIGRPLGRGLIRGRTQPIRIETNHQHRDGDLGKRRQGFGLTGTQRSTRGNMIVFRPAL